MEINEGIWLDKEDGVCKEGWYYYNNNSSGMYSMLGFWKESEDLFPIVPITPGRTCLRLLDELEELVERDFCDFCDLRPCKDNPKCLNNYLCIFEQLYATGELKRIFNYGSV